MAQGTAMQALSRAGNRLSDPSLVEVAARARGAFERNTPTGVRVPQSAGDWYALYSFAPRLYVLNGHLQAVNGLRTYTEFAPADTAAAERFRAGDVAAKARIASFDTGAWSLYSRPSWKPGPEASVNYHMLNRDFCPQPLPRHGRPRLLRGGRPLHAVPEAGPDRRPAPGGSLPRGRGPGSEVPVQALEGRPGGDRRPPRRQDLPVHERLVPARGALHPLGAAARQRRAHLHLHAVCARPRGQLVVRGRRGPGEGRAEAQGRVSSGRLGSDALGGRARTYVSRSGSASSWRGTRTRRSTPRSPKARTMSGSSRSAGLTVIVKLAEVPPGGLAPRRAAIRSAARSRRGPACSRTTRRHAARPAGARRRCGLRRRPGAGAAPGAGGHRRPRTATWRPLKGRRVVLPERAHGLQVLVRARAAALHRHADRAHLRLEVADAHPEDEPSAGSRRRAWRAALRARPDCAAAGSRCPVARRTRSCHAGHEAERDERIEDRVVGLDRRGRDARAGRHDVLAHPQRVVAELLGEGADPSSRRRRWRTRPCSCRRARASAVSAAGLRARPRNRVTATGPSAYVAIAAPKSRVCWRSRGARRALPGPPSARTRARLSGSSIATQKRYSWQPGSRAVASCICCGGGQRHLRACRIAAARPPSPGSFREGSGGSASAIGRPPRPRGPDRSVHGRRIAADDTPHDPLHGQGGSRQDERGRGNRPPGGAQRPSHRDPVDRSRRTACRTPSRPSSAPCPRPSPRTSGARRCRPRPSSSATGTRCSGGSAECCRTAASIASWPRS